MERGPFEGLGQGDRVVPRATTPGIPPLARGAVLPELDALFVVRGKRRGVVDLVNFLADRPDEYLIARERVGI